MIATEYAKYYGISAQRPDESDMEFRARVAGELRAKGKIIEAHEAYQDKYHDTSPDVMIGILGGVAEELTGPHAPDPMRQVGDDIAAGVVVQQEKPSLEMLLLAIMLDKASQQ